MLLVNKLATVWSSLSLDCTLLERLGFILRCTNVIFGNLQSLQHDSKVCPTMECKKLLSSRKIMSSMSVPPNVTYNGNKIIDW